MTARDIIQARDLIEYARKDPTKSFRQGLEEGIAELMAEVRALRRELEAKKK